MSMYDDSNSKMGNRYINGDDKPTDFKWTDLLNNSTLLTLLVRNGKVRKATAWVAREAIRPRFVMKKDNKILGTKFGNSYQFETIIDYLEWIGFFTELEKVITWARLFGNAIMVMFKEDEGEKTHYEALDLYDSCSAYHLLANGNGYEVVKQNNDYVYKITLVDLVGNKKIFTVDKKRVIIFNAPHLELTYFGTSEVEPLAKIAIVQEQMLRSVMKKLHEIGGGIDVIKCNSAEEKAAIKASIDVALTYHSKIYTSDDVDKVLAQFVPDLKSDQFRTIWDITQEEIANDMNMSKKLISGESQGFVSSAQWDVEISYTEVYQTQRHYKKAIEYVLYNLGLKDTSFNWNDPFPTEEKDNDLNVGFNVKGLDNKEEKKEDNKLDNKEDDKKDVRQQ